MTVIDRIQIAWDERRGCQVEDYPERFMWVEGVPFSRFDMFFWGLTGLSLEGGWRTLIYNLRYKQKAEVDAS